MGQRRPAGRNQALFPPLHGLAASLMHDPMPRYDFSAPRLYLDCALAAGAQIALEKDQGNYLLNVLRLGDGDCVLVFNGRDGEWGARLRMASKKSAALAIDEQMRPQDAPCDLHYLFAPIKHARLDYMVQKAVEMGASLLQPVITRRTQAARVNTERMRANAIEAAEQCGILNIPEIAEPLSLEKALAGWPGGRTLVFCDEDEGVADPIAKLRATMAKGSPAAVLIGPEGGFDETERRMIKAIPQALAISIGPRILRADTAAIAALAAVQAAVGDWSG